MFAIAAKFCAEQVQRRWRVLFRLSCAQREAGRRGECFSIPSEGEASQGKIPFQRNLVHAGCQKTDLIHEHRRRRGQMWGEEGKGGGANEESYA